MISEEYIEREKRVAECYKRYFDSRPELKKALDESKVDGLSDNITEKITSQFKDNN